MRKRHDVQRTSQHHPAHRTTLVSVIPSLGLTFENRISRAQMSSKSQAGEKTSEVDRFAAFSTKPSQAFA
jgi:hypothetical protein